MKKSATSKIAGFFGGKGAYFALACAVIAAGGAGAAAYGKAVLSAEKSYDIEMPQLDSSSFAGDMSAAAAEKKQQGVKRGDSSLAGSSSADTSSSDKSAKSSPNLMPVNGKILTPYSGGELVKSGTLGIWKTHDGVDIAAEQGTPVKAMNSGEVTQVSEDPLWGYTVMIDHGNGVMSCYYNLSSAVAVSEGDEVEAGQTIGAVGDTAEIEAAEASHLHFAVKYNGEWIDPIGYIKPNSNK